MTQRLPFQANTDMVWHIDGCDCTITTQLRLLSPKCFLWCHKFLTVVMLWWKRETWYSWTLAQVHTNTSVIKHKITNHKEYYCFIAPCILSEGLIFCVLKPRRGQEPNEYSLFMFYFHLIISHNVWWMFNFCNRIMLRNCCGHAICYVRSV